MWILVLNWWLCCRTDGAEDQYSVLINFDTQSSTDSFYKHFNGKQFSSLEVLISFYSAGFSIVFSPDDVIKFYNDY